MGMYSSSHALLQGILESWFDGVLILNEQRECLHSNKLARRICVQLSQEQPQSNQIPEAIWRVCQALIESRNYYGNESIILEDEITTPRPTALRIRVRWFPLNAITDSCLLVILEDQYQSLQELAISESNHYNLTPRETEVWFWRRANYSYKKIADKLHITLDTVKKHMKNIHAKQKIALDRVKWLSNFS
ncbi:MAG TPA: helix-turn-helix transcriptional regulator [Cyanobacteria bacterium UBA12227]|nr:helix-turn-helix transcriptional regulator [Cyanobacteria bacterium UBA12227]HAX86336.1 helix-turn-helix transcriptional regulator [Cyanobacteria bacterium UBA11370]HBY76610.1 helix-turn-helix transcriptional regulator [Cyanobacteria bacterium UBA11148]